MLRGTAFNLGNDIGLITCNHVLSFNEFYADTFEIFNPAVSGKNYKVKVVAKDEYLDLALLRFIDEPPPTDKFFEFSDKATERGHGVYLVGYPNYSPGKTSPNITPTAITNLFNQYASLWIEIGELIRAGNSGGPILDNELKVIGIALKGATQDSGNNEGLEYTEIKKWLNSVLAQ